MGEGGRDSAMKEEKVEEKVKARNRNQFRAFLTVPLSPDSARRMTRLPVFLRILELPSQEQAPP
jgi:hypothetical protein